MRKSWWTVSSPGALCRISSSVAGLIPGERTSATPWSVLQISDRHLRRYPLHNAHSPANRCSGCSNTCTWSEKKCRLITFNAALTGKVQVLVTLTTKHDRARIDPQVRSKRNSVINIQDFPTKNASGRPPLHSGGPQKLYQLAGVGVYQLRALAPEVLLWTPSCILSRMPRSLLWITTGRYLR